MNGAEQVTRWREIVVEIEEVQSKRPILLPGARPENSFHFLFLFRERDTI
jgi:hypothetical protein